MSSAQRIKKALRQAADPAKAKILQGFFKTGPGQYGEGDVFLGVVVPKVRSIVAPFLSAPLSEVRELLDSRIHEERFAGVLLLTLKAKRAETEQLGRLCAFYLAQRRHINNWDLVDVSAPHVVGAAFADRDRAPLYRLARSKRMWDRRVAVISTFHFIRQGDFDDTLAIVASLLGDEHDLMHKACGWMLREVGKRSSPRLEKFLARHSPRMPRTMLRYAIERFPEKKRLTYLKAGKRAPRA